MSETGKVKNISGEDLIDAWSGGRLVVAGATLDVPLEQVWAYTQQAERWAPYDAAAKKAHKPAFEADEARYAAELAAAEPAADESPGDESGNPSDAGDAGQED